MATFIAANGQTPATAFQIAEMAPPVRFSQRNRLMRD